MQRSFESQPFQLSLHSFKEALLSLEANPYPHVANPPNCKRRASVALVIRIRPAHGQQPEFRPLDYSPDVGFRQRLDIFFSQSWVKSGTPEVLFIKRAARASDRWGGHVAFPGGTREESDADDCATCIRETEEEVGLSLTGNSCLKIGNLPERLVTAVWGKKPLMVLCPFIFLLLQYDIPPLDPQPTEVGSIHWVPLNSILDPDLRSRQTAAISDRVVPLQRPSIQKAFQIIGGNLMFAAVRLQPLESKYAVPLSGSAGYETNKAAKEYFIRNVYTAKQPLLLWGLTLGMLADFLHVIDVEATESLWSWPTFQHWDFRLVCWLFTHSIRNSRRPNKLLSPQQAGGGLPTGDVDASTYTKKGVSNDFDRKISIAGGHMLEDYFDRMKRALTVAVGLRISLSVVLLAIALKRGLGKT